MLITSDSEFVYGALTRKSKQRSRMLKDKSSTYDSILIKSTGPTSELLRSIDWTTHPLGPIDSWPETLKTALRILFHSQHPMFIWWGPQLFQFYNDAYLPSFGIGKHPRAMGQKGAECWPEIWPIIKPQIDSVMNEGVSTWNENQLVPIFRNGKIEDVYWTYGYSPIFNADHTIGGTLVVCTETTALVEARKAETLAVIAERKLRDSVQNAHTQLLNVFDNMTGPVAMLSGPNHVFRYTNANYRRLFLGGKNPEGITVLKTFPAAEEQGFIQLLDEVYHTGLPFKGIETRFDFLDENLVSKVAYLNFVYEAVRNSQGEIYGVLAAITDVTEQVLQRQIIANAARDISIERRKLDLMIKEAPVGVALIKGPELKFEIANQHWQDLVPTKREYIGRSYDAVYPELIASGLSKTIAKVFDTGETFTAYEMLIPVENSEGILEDRYYDFSYIRMTDDNHVPYGVFSVAVNVTHRVLSQRELSLAKSDAEKANELKSAFLANMSHEIRTPLGAMIGFADLMKDTGLSLSERSNYINILLRNGEQLSVIINDILDLSKVEAGHLTLEYIDTIPQQIGSEIIQIMQAKAREKDLALEFITDPSTPSVITSDPTRVRQILLNLVGNAIKFTQYGSVKIRTFGCQTDLGKPALGVEIVDTGIGISASQMERLFKSFSQADDTTTRRFGGTGLGLALSRKLARALNGDIHIAESAEGFGTTFVVKIADQPDRRSTTSELLQTRSLQETQIKERALSGLKILVVDDSPDNQQLIWLYLSKQGAVVESAENGLTGYRAAVTGKFDLVLMDIQMPIMDGYMATQKLREAGYQKPVIALTAHAMSEIRKKALNVGYTDHLTKPINAEELIRMIVRYTSASNDQL
jgi:signal transduction histidine kinase/CheY-like chemotaxis protein/PAS domain-containing protein